LILDYFTIAVIYDVDVGLVNSLLFRAFSTQNALIYSKEKRKKN